ncbi:hypothetical protein ACP6JE_000542 [Aspergillus fumigatus]
MTSAYSKVKELTTASIAQVLTVSGYLSAFLLSFTINRAFLASALLPLYLLSLAYRVLPTIFRNAPRLLLPNWWKTLVKDAEQYRQRVDALAQSQLEGTYRFKDDEILRTDRKGKGWMADMPWRDNVEEFSVFPALVERGHEVYALDWLGHGRSDKITRPEAITFELHMRTLQQFFESTGLDNTTIVAHDWGGCVALSTLSRLPTSACTSLFLLNSFFPLRISEISMHYALLHAIWFMTTGILGGCTPESAVMRFMSPSISQNDVTGYAAPYRNLPSNAKSIEGLAGPSNFDNLTAQARLSLRNEGVRSFWKSSDRAHQLEVAVVFGDKDPLLKDYKDILVRGVDSRVMVDWAPYGIWLDGTGHYPAEDKPKAVGDLIARLARYREPTVMQR